MDNNLREGNENVEREKRINDMSKNQSGLNAAEGRPQNNIWRKEYEHSESKENFDYRG